MPTTKQQKLGPYVSFFARIPDPLYQQMVEAARAQGVSIALMLTYIIQGWAEAKKGE